MSNQLNLFADETRDYIPLPVPSIWRLEVNFGPTRALGTMTFDSLSSGTDITGSIFRGTPYYRRISGEFRQGVLNIDPRIDVWDDFGYNYIGLLRIVPGPPTIPAGYMYRITGTLWLPGFPRTTYIPWEATHLAPAPQP